MMKKYEAPCLIEINDKILGSACANGSGDNCIIGCVDGCHPEVYYPGHGYIELGCGNGIDVAPQ